MKHSSFFQGWAAIAYFSMEVGITPSIPTYSGGLGVLAGDTIRAAADLGIPMAAVTLVHRKGYFRQTLDRIGNQSESPCPWEPEHLLEPLEPRVSIVLEGRRVWVRAWRRLVRGISGWEVPVFFLDTAVLENAPWDQGITDHLYGGDPHYRLCQEAVLGLGGVAVLRSLGYSDIQAYHMNEGHSALLALALLEEQEARGRTSLPREELIESVRKRCVFTTHTPVPAGHDQFPLGLVRRVLGPERAAVLEDTRCCLDGVVNMTYLALRFSRYINGVSHRHEEISQTMFPSYPINSITNGVHAPTWTSPSFGRLYDRHIPEWRYDNLYLRYAVSIPLEEIAEAHRQAKETLMQEVQRRSGCVLKPELLTLGFARRATEYKRADLLFSDLERLRTMARDAGALQIVYAGKAHPRDEGGKRQIRKIFEAAMQLAQQIPVVYLEDYDMELGLYLCSGVDLWLNTPQKPQEASGTSGMKAALNGVPSLSVLDGWWIEGHVEGVTGWSIGDPSANEDSLAEEIGSMYQKLEHTIIPMYYNRFQEYAKVMRSTIGLNGSFFNSQRMIYQYVKNAYPDDGPFNSH